MAKDLLDLMLDDHAQRSTADAKKAVAPGTGNQGPKLTAAEAGMAQALNEARMQAQMEAMKAAQRRAAEKAMESNAPAELSGLRVGSRFEMRKCAPEVNGRYVVAAVDPGAEADRSRTLTARREDGRPGALRLDGAKIRDCLHYGVLVPLDR